MELGNILKINKEVLPNFGCWDYRYKIIDIYTIDGVAHYKLDCYNAPKGCGGVFTMPESSMFKFIIENNKEVA